MENLHNNIHLMLESTLLLLIYINGLSDDCICNIAIYAECDQACDLWQQLKLVSELESDLQDTVD